MTERFTVINNLIFTLLADLFFLWVLFEFGLDGWGNLFSLLTYYGYWSVCILVLVLFLILYGSDFRQDLPLFAAGLALGYWGEWWGTTRGVWTYWNGATPPLYLPPLWGIGLITVHQLSKIMLPVIKKELPKWVVYCLIASFFLLPLLTLAYSFPRLAGIEWAGRLDFHFLLGILVTLALILPNFDLRQTFAVYVCGMLLGGMYEYLGTSIGEWTYITHEIPPLWIVPLWGLAAAAMVRLAGMIRWTCEGVFTAATRRKCIVSVKRV